MDRAIYRIEDCSAVSPTTVSGNWKPHSQRRAKSSRSALMLRAKEGVGNGAVGLVGIADLLFADLRSRWRDYH